MAKEKQASSTAPVIKHVGLTSAGYQGINEREPKILECSSSANTSAGGELWNVDTFRAVALEQVLAIFQTLKPTKAPERLRRTLAKVLVSTVTVIRISYAG